MPKLDIQPFADEHLPAAATLLAERHRAHREAEPLLPDVSDFRAHVEEEWSKEDATGWLALRDDEPAGYLIGSPRSEVWGAGNVWVGLAGHAVREPEIVRDLYREAAAAWVNLGLRRHYAMVPATDQPLVDGWFRLSFGAQHALAIREVPADAITATPGIDVREATVDDLEAVLPLESLLFDHQRESPVFGGGELPDPDQVRADMKEELEDPNSACLLAHLDGRAVGCATVADVSLSSMHEGLARPERASILGYAGTLPEVRGSGAGVALTNAVFAWAREHDYETIVVDWRETNLLSSRFWPARGFRRTFQRLYRSIP